jgi:hypothetical protein
MSGWKSMSSSAVRPVSIGVIYTFYHPAGEARA